MFGIAGVYRYGGIREDDIAAVGQSGLMTMVYSRITRAGWSLDD
jgi:hypothetical protein